MSTPPAVEKIERCHLSQRQVCHRNPHVGAETKIAVKQSLEQSITRQHMRGTLRLHKSEEKRRKPDIYLDCCGRYLSIDVKHWTATEARHSRVYLCREFYGYQRGKDTLTTYLKDGKRFLFVAFELMMVDQHGKGERRLLFVPGRWLKKEFELSPDACIFIDKIVEAWPSFGKDKTRLYNIDMWKLIEISENEETWM